MGGSTMSVMNIGSRVYYTGDPVNAAGYGTVTAILPGSLYTVERVRILMDDGRKIVVWNRVIRDVYLGGEAQFVTAEAYGRYRQAKLDTYLRAYERAQVRVPAENQNFLTEA